MPASQLAGIDIEFRYLKHVERLPITVVVGISSEGIVGPLAASHLIQQLGMDQVCALDSSLFPPISVVYFQKPKFPARIYHSNEHRLAVVLAEFGPDADTARALALAIRAWCDLQGVRTVVGVEGFAVGDVVPPVPLAAVGSMEADRQAIRRAKLPQLEHGIVGGVAGILLNEGRWRGARTIVLAAALGGGPDEQAAIEVVRGLRRLLPRLPLAVEPAVDAATQVEKAIRTARERTSQEFI